MSPWSTTLLTNRNTQVPRIVYTFSLYLILKKKLILKSQRRCRLDVIL